MKNKYSYFFRACALALGCIMICMQGLPQTPATLSGSMNEPNRLDWFQDQGFGIFIHWSVDSQLGVVISHSLVDASPEYRQRFFHDLPETFYPQKFDADSLARLIRISGARYMVFTTKHHSGFAMFDTATTKFGVMNTPFHRDITAELFAAVRRQGIAPGVYFSPDDFYWLDQHHITINRSVPNVMFKANPGLLSYDEQQLHEILTNYGSLDLIFFDGEAQDLRTLAWKLQPNIVVTRGAIASPEQTVPGSPLPGPWEACMTMGTAWQYQPQHEVYKSGPQLISLLVRTRARGGNLLLDVGPKPDGELPIEQEERLREIGLWMFVNSDAIYAVRPWNITNEGDVWFTQSKPDEKKGDSTLYATVDRPTKRGQKVDVLLKSVLTSSGTDISVLGQAGKVLEYQAAADPAPRWSQQDDGLHIRITRTQRLQDDGNYYDPIVIRITHARQGFTPPVAETRDAESAGTGVVEFHGEWSNPGRDTSVETGFEYRSITGEDTNSRTKPWVATSFSKASKPGQFTAKVSGLEQNGDYEVRSVVRHPLLTVYGKELKFHVP